MLELKKIAVTGGLATGKSTVCKILKDLGAYVVSADEIVHQLLSSGTTISQQIASLLGLTSQELDRKKIAALVFSKPDLLADMEEILHPAVFSEIERQYEKVNKEKKFSLFVAEIPLLYEVGAEDRFDAVVTVVADKEKCKHRYAQMHPSSKDFDQRMKRQLTNEQKAKRAQFVVENNGSLAALNTKVKALKESNFQ